MAATDVKNTLKIAVILSLCCAIAVCTAVVLLKPLQEENKKHDLKINVLLAAQKISDRNISKEKVNELFKNFTPTIIDLETGEKVSNIDVEKFNEKDAVKNPLQSISINVKDDLGKIKRRAKYAKVFIEKDQAGELKQIILNVYGKGLWSTMYAFLSLNPDGKTVNGISFYEHGETPGLGGEVDNTKWKMQWKGKVLTDDANVPIFQVLKGKVSSDDPASIHQVDGLSGATLTSRGVENLILYWLGENGFGVFLRKIKEQGVRL